MLPLVAVWTIVLLVDIVAAVAVATGLRFDDGLQVAFDSDNPRYRAYREQQDRFAPSDGNLAVLFRAPDFADPEILEQVSDFALEAQLIEGVADTASIFSVRDPADPRGLRPLLPIELPPPGMLAAVLDGARGVTAATPFMSADRGLTLVLVTLADGGESSAAARRVEARLRALAASTVSEGVTSVQVTGAPAVRNLIVDQLYGDLVKLTLIGLGLGFAIGALALRSLPLALLATLPSGTALLWALGALALLGYPVNVLTVALPVLVLVLAIADCLHLTFENRRLLLEENETTGAALTALRRIGPACALAALTTAIAFAGLTLSGALLIRDLGFAGMTATLVALIAVLVVQPLVFLTAARAGWYRRLFRSGRQTPALFDWHFLPAFALRRPAAITASAGILLAAAALAYTGIRPVYSFMENVDADHPAAEALTAIDRELIPITTIDIPVLLTDDGLSSASLERVETVHAAVERVAGVDAAISLARLVPGGERRAERTATLIERMSETQRSRFLSRDADAAIVRIHNPDRGSVATRALVGGIEAALAADPDIAPETVGPVGGFEVMAAFVTADAITDLNICFLFAVVASGLLTVIWFGNLRYGLVALVPNVLPILMVGAFLSLSGWGLQFSSGVALTIAFGIAVDDTVHILNRMRLNAPPGAPFAPDAIRRSMEEVTPVLVVTTTVLAFGLLANFASQIPMVRYFGGLAIAVFFLAIVADLLVLPALMRLMHARGHGAALERAA